MSLLKLMREWRLLFIIIVLFMIYHAYYYATPFGGLIDWATYYQSMRSIMHGDLLGLNYVPHLPYLAEHFSPILILYSPISLLPSWLAYLIAFTIQVAVILYFTSRLSSRLTLNGVLPILIMLTPSWFLNPVPETYDWSLLAPIAVGLLATGDEAAAWIAYALSALGIEFIPPYLFAGTYTILFIYSRLTSSNLTNVKGLIKVYSASLITLIIQYTVLHFLRVITHYPLLNVFNNIIGLGSFSVWNIPFFIISLLINNAAALLTIPGLLSTLLTLPLLFTNQLYYEFMVYYMAPFTAATIITVVLLSRRVSDIRIMFAGYGGAVAFALIVSFLPGPGLHFTPQPTPLLAADYYLSMHFNASSLIAVNGQLCGYGSSTLVAHCAPPAPPLAYGVNASESIWLSKFIIPSNLWFIVNPHYNVDCGNVTLIKLNNIPVGGVVECPPTSPMVVVNVDSMSVALWWIKNIAVYIMVSIPLAALAYIIAITALHRGKPFKHI